MSYQNAVTFCVFSSFLAPYVSKGIVPFLDNADELTVEDFAPIQAKPGEESPEIRLERITKTAREGRRLVFAVDAFIPVAMSAVQYCHSVLGVSCGLILKVNSSLPMLSKMHREAPFGFVLAVGATQELQRLFPGAKTQNDRSNRLTAPVHAKDFVLQQLAATVH